MVIESVNDAPTITVTSSLWTNEDTATDIAISIDDIDFGETWGATFTVIVSVSHGTLSLHSRQGLYISIGFYDNVSKIQFQASKLNVNTALNPITYVPDLNYFGNDILNIAVNDEGNTGKYGGAQWTNTSVFITVNESNADDLVPIINGFGDYIQCFEDITCFMGNVGISIFNEAKESNTNFTVHLGVLGSMGTLTVNPMGLDMVDFLEGDGTLDEVVTFYGNLSNVNNAFFNFSFLSTIHNHGYQGFITLNVTNDLGDRALMTRNLYIDAVNDVPVISLPFSSATMDEDGSLQIVGITVVDIDLNDTWYGVQCLVPGHFEGSHVALS